jgi:hypothetical protein
MRCVHYIEKNELFFTVMDTLTLSIRTDNEFIVDVIEYKGDLDQIALFEKMLKFRQTLEINIFSKSELKTINSPFLNEWITAIETAHMRNQFVQPYHTTAQIMTHVEIQHEVCKTVFEWACYLGKLPAVVWIASHIVPPTYTNFLTACTRGHLKLAKWLYSTYKINYHVQYALKAACTHGHLHVARWLYEECGAYLHDRLIDQTIYSKYPHIGDWLTLHGCKIYSVAWGPTHQRIKYSTV